MIIDKLQKQGLVQPPKWLAANTHFLCAMGSTAYGVSTDSSDEDVYGWCIPPKDLVFPHLAGEIPGFGRQIQKFGVWQQHHIKTLDGQKEYDFAVYGIVQYFSLLMENNPNIIDSLFVPERCIKHSTDIARMVRDQRQVFLHKGAWHKFKGYSYSQLHKIDIKRQNVPEVVRLQEICADLDLSVKTIFDQPVSEYNLSIDAAADLKRSIDAVKALGARYVNIVRHGFCVKFAYHVVRLISEIEQILVEHDLDLQRNREQLKAIRRGDWSYDDIVRYFEDKERQLETIYLKSTLPAKPDEKRIKQILMDCLEHHYGDISTAVARDISVDTFARDIQAVVDRYKGQ